MSAIGSDNSSTKSANNGSPRPPIKWDETESSGGLHVGDAGSAAASGTKTGSRFAPPHLTGLIHEKTKANHFFPPSSCWRVIERGVKSLKCMKCVKKVEPLYKDF